MCRRWGIHTNCEAVQRSTLDVQPTARSCEVRSGFELKVNLTRLAFPKPFALQLFVLAPRQDERPACSLLRSECGSCDIVAVNKDWRA